MDGLGVRSRFEQWSALVRRYCSGFSSRLPTVQASLESLQRNCMVAASKALRVRGYCSRLSVLFFSVSSLVCKILASWRIASASRWHCGRVE